MVSEQVREQIEAQAQLMLVSNPLLLRARQGLVVPRVVHSYLRSVHYLISRTVPHLSAARQRAIESGDVELAEYFDNKALEEYGHETWAESDMHRLSQCFGDVGPVVPVPSIVRLTEYVEELIADDPRLYVAYMLCAEYMTVLLGPAWVSALTCGCGVPAAALTVVSKHVDADSAHALEGFDALERFASAPELRSRLRPVVDSILGQFAQFPEDLLRLCPGSVAEATAVQADIVRQ